MSDIDWQAIRAEYEAGGISLRKLAAKYNISKTYLIERRNNDQWNRPAILTTVQKDENAKSNTRDVNAAVKVHMAIKIYLEERPTWEEIAARAGYASRGAAHNAVMRELNRCVTHDVKELRTVELYMIEKTQARSYKEANDPSREGWTWSADRFIALSKRKSELMGLDKRPDEELANQNYIKKVVLTHSDGEQNVSS